MEQVINLVNIKGDISFQYRQLKHNDDMSGELAACHVLLYLINSYNFTQDRALELIEEVLN